MKAVVQRQVAVKMGGGGWEPGQKTKEEVRARQEKSKRRAPSDQEERTSGVHVKVGSGGAQGPRNRDSWCFWRSPAGGTVF